MDSKQPKEESNIEEFTLVTKQHYVREGGITRWVGGQSHIESTNGENINSLDFPSEEYLQLLKTLECMKGWNGYRMNL